MNIELKSSDKVIIDKRVINISKLINNIVEDYPNEEIKLDIDLDKFNKFKNFCEIINYDDLNLKRPFIILEKFKEIINENNRLTEFYNSLESKDICDYFKIADYLDTKSLEDILYIKLIEAFQDEESMKDFFKSESEIGKLAEIDELEIKKRYFDHIMKYCENLKNDEVDEMIEKLNIV